jgi:hypothetical protein
MEIPILLATMWFPSLNPVGTASVSAFGVGLLGLILTERWKRIDFNLGRAVLIVIVPFLLLGCVVYSKIALGAFQELDLSFSWQNRTFPDAVDYCANYVYLAFGFVISLRAWRLPSEPFRVLGILESVLLASLIISEFATLSRVT